MKKTPILIDCVARHNASPATFEIPSNQRKRRLRVGDSVQIIVRSPYPDAILGGERIWLELTEIIDGVFTGTVESFIFSPIDMEVDFRDTISFEAKHVLAIRTIAEKAATNAEVIESLHPLYELIQLPEDPDDGVEMDEEMFEQVLLSTIPNDLAVWITGDDLPTIVLSRRADEIEALVALAFAPQSCAEESDLRLFGKAMVEAVKVLNADGHPLENPEFEDDQSIGALWYMKFPVTERPDLLLKEIEHYCERIDSSAEQLLLGDD